MRIGIDLSRNGILGVLVDNSVIVNSLNKSVELSQNEPKERVMDTIISVISYLLTPYVKGIGLSLPSQTDPQKGTIYDLALIPNWKGIKIKKIIENHFHIPTYINNDINCMALGEKHYGSCKNNKNILCITLGTNAGTSAIIDDELYINDKHSFEDIECLSQSYYHLIQKDKSKYTRAINEIRFFVERYYKELKNPEHEIWRNVGIITGRLISSLLSNFNPETIILYGYQLSPNTIYLDTIKEYADLFIKPRQNITDLISFSHNTNNRAIGASYLVPKAA